MITPVNGNFLVEPLLRTEAEKTELRERLAKSGLVLPTNAGDPDNRTKFEGVPCEGFIRYLPEDYSGELTAGMHIVFREDNPKGFKHGGVTLFGIKADQIMAVVMGGK